jgi:hypothetical protein
MDFSRSTLTILSVRKKGSKDFCKAATSALFGCVSSSIVSARSFDGLFYPDNYR